MLLNDVILHMLCAIFNIEVTVDSMNMPLWISIVGFFVPAILSAGLWKESKK